jgi:catechol-2,3-dioxygenase
MSREIDTQTVIRPVRFAHVVLRTRHLKESIAFYSTLVGMKTVFENPLVAFLTFDDEHHRLALIVTPEAKPAPAMAAGLDHIAYTMNDLGELLGTYARLKAEGIEPVWTINHGPTTSIYYQDPDGNRVELQIENFDSQAALDTWMQSGDFQKNPIGVEFDPAKLLARYREGVPEDELKRQGAA